MNHTAQEFYDNLAENYHLIAQGWDLAVANQGKILSNLIGKHLPLSNKLSILDCSCGIGTQAIGLALNGYEVTATDVSPKAIEQAVQNAIRLNAKLSFGVADFRTLDRDVDGTFDVVLSCDNSLPHLLADDDLKLTTTNILKKLKPGGLFLASIRDYDDL